MRFPTISFQRPAVWTLRASALIHHTFLARVRDLGSEKMARRRITHRSGGNKIPDWRKADERRPLPRKARDATAECDLLSTCGGEEEKRKGARGKGSVRRGGLLSPPFSALGFN